MLGEDKDALICDMAETYHVLDIWALPVELLATLASGLRDNSRIKMKLSGMEHIPVDLVMPFVADTLTMVFRDKNAEKPQLFTDLMMGRAEKKKTVGFTSAEAFAKEWERIVRG